ncbi:MAG: FAD-binding oxidoreductase, partial [Sphingobacteriales bacterium]
WSAYYLKKAQPHLSVTILEKGIIPTGASTRNAGFACFGSVTELLHDIRTMGQDKTMELVQLRYDGLRRIRKVFSKDEIEYERNGGYELITAAQYPKLKQLKNDIGLLNILLRKTIKQDKVFKLADKQLTAFGFKSTQYLVGNKLEAQLHSGKLVTALLQKVQGMGVQVITQCHVTSFDKQHGLVSLNTNLPVPLTAKQILICTNGFAKQLLPAVDVLPQRGQVLVTAPLKKIPFKGCFHYDGGFYYFRNLGNRVLLGGGRNLAIDEEQSNELIITHKIQDGLEQFLKEFVLPGQQYTIEHRWSGIMGMGKQKMPVIKEVQKNIFCCVRMSGMGVALAPVVSNMVVKKMLESKK